MQMTDQFEQLKSQYQLNDADFYLLDLIPLINMIWADDINQEAELKLLHQFVIEHISHLDQQLAGLSLSVADANHFLQRFAYQKPDPELIDALMQLYLEKPRNYSTHKKIMEQCLDIAAACITRYPYDLRERVMANEKELITDLFNALNQLKAD